MERKEDERRRVIAEIRRAPKHVQPERLAATDGIRTFEANTSTMPAKPVASPKSASQTSIARWPPIDESGKHDEKALS